MNGRPSAPEGSAGQSEALAGPSRAVAVAAGGLGIAVPRPGSIFRCAICASCGLGITTGNDCGPTYWVHSGNRASCRVQR
jgi:hypothetical protein